MKSSRSGQAIVFVLLIMLLGLTVALSMTSRTLQDLKQTTVTDQSSRAFSMAEAGIEAGLADLTVGNKEVVVDGTTVNYQIAQAAVNSYVTSTAIAENEIAQINFPTGYTGNITVSWTLEADSSENPGCSQAETTGTNPAAVEISVYTKNGINYDVKKYAYLPKNCAIVNNNFTTPAATSVSPYRSTAPAIAITATDKAYLRIRPIYNKASIMVTGNGLPSQTYTITAYATVSETTRALQVIRTGTALPPTFDYALFSTQAL